MVSIETERLKLVSSGGVAAKDISAFLSANRSFFEPWSPRVADAFFTLPFLEQQQQKDADMERLDLQYKFYIFFKGDTSEIIAQLSLSQIIRGPFQSCFMGYMTAEKHCRKGIMSEAIGEVVRFAFTQLKLHRIEANIIPRNVASVKLAEKAGFECEGLAKKYLQINGTWEDHLHYTIRNKEME